MKRTIRTMVAMVAGLITIGLAVSQTSAQEKHKYSFVSPPGVSTYTQQREIEVGDVPGHKVRIFEIRAKFAGEAPRYAGVKVVETAHEGPATRRHHHPRHATRCGRRRTSRPG